MANYKLHTCRRIIKLLSHHNRTLWVCNSQYRELPRTHKYHVLLGDAHASVIRKSAQGTADAKGVRTSMVLDHLHQPQEGVKPMTIKGNHYRGHPPVYSLKEQVNPAMMDSSLFWRCCS